MYTSRGGDSVKLVLSPSKKESTLYGKNLVPLGAICFLVE